MPAKQEEDGVPRPSLHDLTGWEAHPPTAAPALFGPLLRDTELGGEVFLGSFFEDVPFVDLAIAVFRRTAAHFAEGHGGGDGGILDFGFWIGLRERRKVGPASLRAPAHRDRRCLGLRSWVLGSWGLSCRNACEEMKRCARILDRKPRRLHDLRQRRNASKLVYKSISRAPPSRWFSHISHPLLQLACDVSVLRRSPPTADQTWSRLQPVFGPFATSFSWWCRNTIPWLADFSRASRSWI